MFTRKQLNKIPWMFVTQYLVKINLKVACIEKNCCNVESQSCIPNYMARK